LRQPGLVSAIGIYLYVTGPASAVERWKKTTHDIVCGMKPWYDPIARRGWANPLGILLIFGGLVAACAAHPDPKAQILVIACCLLGPLLLIAPLCILKRAAFPVGAFAINKGLERHEMLESWRWLYVGGVIVAFMINVAAGVIAIRLI